MSAYIIILALNSYSTCLNSSFILIPTVDTLGSRYSFPTPTVIKMLKTM